MSSQPPQLSGDVYNDLTTVFAHHDGRHLEFEILPSGFLPVVQYDGETGSLGFTKKALLGAFLHARKQFFAHLRAEHQLPADIGDTDVVREAQDEEGQIYLASTVLLLFDAEHLTAANFRKRRLQNPASSNRHHLPFLVQNEIQSTLNILVSPLHRHSKSPTLWSHLLWLQKKQDEMQEGGWKHVLGVHPDVSGERRDAVGLHAVERHMRHRWEAVVDSALRAGERHPRNYYAFGYARTMLPTCADWQPQKSVPTEDSESTKYNTYDTGTDFRAELAADMLHKVHHWCLAHPRDISGWCFLLWLVDNSWNRWNKKQCAGIVRKTVDWAVSPGIRWDGESLWTFVDLACKKGYDRELRLSTTIETLQKGVVAKDEERVSWRKFRALVLRHMDPGVVE